jgi:hypothetical protein
MWRPVWVCYFNLWSLNIRRFCCGPMYCQSDCEKCNYKLLTKSTTIHRIPFNWPAIVWRISTAEHFSEVRSSQCLMQYCAPAICLVQILRVVYRVGVLNVWIYVVLFANTRRRHQTANTLFALHKRSYLHR